MKFGACWITFSVSSGNQYFKLIAYKVIPDLSVDLKNTLTPPTTLALGPLSQQECEKYPSALFTGGLSTCEECDLNTILLRWERVLVPTTETDSPVKGHADSAAASDGTKHSGGDNSD